MSSNWREYTLDELCLKITDGSHQSPKAYEGGRPMFSVKDMTEFGFSYTGVKRISEIDYLKLVKQGCRPEMNDILIAKDGSVMKHVFKVESDIEGVLLSSIAIIRPNLKKVDPDFLVWSLLNPAVKEDILNNYVSGSGVPRIVLKDFKKIVLKVPENLNDQKETVKILRSLNKKIKLNRQTNQTLEQISQAIFKSWFVDFDPVKAKIAALEAGGSENDALLAAMQAIAGSALFATDAADADAPTQLARLQTEHPEQYATLRATAELFPSAMQESELGEIPEGWEASTLSDFCEFQNGYAFKGKDWADSGFPVVKIGSVKPGFVDLTKVSYVSSETVAGLERFELKAGDILVGMTGYPGETGLVPNYADRVFLNQRVGRFIPNEKYLYAYIFSAVRGSEFKVFVESQAHGSAQANISGKAILQYPLISGSKNLMMRFYEVVNPQIQQMICLNAESSQLGELRDTLLPKLLSGEITLAEEVKRS